MNLEQWDVLAIIADIPGKSGEDIRAVYITLNDVAFGRLAFKDVTSQLEALGFVRRIPKNNGWLWYPTDAGRAELLRLKKRNQETRRKMALPVRSVSK